MPVLYISAPVYLVWSLSSIPEEDGKSQDAVVANNNLPLSTYRHQGRALSVPLRIIILVTKDVIQVCLLLLRSVQVYLHQIWGGLLGDLANRGRRFIVDETGSVGSGKFGVLVVNTIYRNLVHLELWTAEFPSKSVRTWCINGFVNGNSRKNIALIR